MDAGRYVDRARGGARVDLEGGVQRAARRLPRCRARRARQDSCGRHRDQGDERRLADLGRPGYSRDNPLERYLRDARMFTIAGGTAQVLRTLVASSILGRKLPQTRDGYLTEDLGRSDMRRDKQSAPSRAKLRT